jgi:hypothetical protein
VLKQKLSATAPSGAERKKNSGVIWLNYAKLRFSISLPERTNLEKIRAGISDNTILKGLIPPAIY